MSLTFPKELSIVIPLYNEEERFPEGFKICSELAKKYPNWEFIFVNDGSTDKTQKVVRWLLKGKNMLLISYKKNLGKGFAINRGIMEAKKPLVLFTDIDFSTPIEELALLYPFIEKGADMVIGTRKVKGARIQKHQGKLREWMGKQFTHLTNLWLGLDVTDYTCGFKLFKTPIAKNIFEKQKIRRWGFDAEMLFLANLFHYQIVEVPIMWQNDARTKVSIIKDTIRSLQELWQIRWNQFTGKYSHSL